MTATGNNIFLLEVIAYRVILTDPEQVANTCPICVCFRFPELVHLEICEGDFCEEGRWTSGVGGEICMRRGKSCLFAVGTGNLCKASRDFRANISVYRRVSGGPKTLFVAQTVLEFDKRFIDLILDPNQQDRTRDVKKVRVLYITRSCHNSVA